MDLKMSACNGQRRKVFSGKSSAYKVASPNNSITTILNKQTMPPRSNNKILPKGFERHVKSPRKKSPEVMHTRERGLPSDDSGYSDHIVRLPEDKRMLVADERLSGQEMPVNGSDSKENFRKMPIEECRQIYRNEITTLWKEVEEFRITCQREMARQKAMLEEHRRNCEETMRTEKGLRRAPDVTEDKDYTKELKALKENMHTLEEKQKILDKEQALADREEVLTKRQEQLKQYEKDVEEAEAMLDKRQNIAKRRSQEVELLNHDLLLMKQDLAESLQSAEDQFEGSETMKSDLSSEPGEQTTSDVGTITNSPTTSCKARRNWQVARRHLIDKVTLLETTIQRYRTQVASSSATITAKDMVISRLQKEAAEMRDELAQKDKRIKQLESQLSLSLEDKTRSEKKLDMLLEELQNIDLSAISKFTPSPEKSPPKNETTNKRKLLKKQQSMFSFLTHHGSDKNENSSAPGLLRRRTWESAKKRDVTPKNLNQNDTKTEEDASKNGTTNNDSEEMTFNDLEGKRDTDTLADLQDDLGSKACVVM